MHKLTPAQNDIHGDGARVGKQSHKDKIMQVKTFHENPRIIGHDKVLPEGSYDFTLPLL